MSAVIHGTVLNMGKNLVAAALVELFVVALLVSDRVALSGAASVSRRDLPSAACHVGPLHRGAVPYLTKGPQRR